MICAMVGGGAKEEVLPVVVQLHHARQQLGASRRRLCRELARAREDRLYIGGRMDPYSTTP